MVLVDLGTEAIVVILPVAKSLASNPSVLPSPSTHTTVLPATAGWAWSTGPVAIRNSVPVARSLPRISYSQVEQLCLLSSQTTVEPVIRGLACLLGAFEMTKLLFVARSNPNTSRVAPIVNSVSSTGRTATDRSLQMRYEVAPCSPNCTRLVSILAGGLGLWSHVRVASCATREGDVAVTAWLADGLLITGTRVSAASQRTAR